MECKHVFIVDDDADVRSSYQEALTMEGFEVASAIHGKDAIEKLSAMKPEDLPGCIFLDLKMPVMDGRDFLKTVESGYQDSIGLIPIVVVSANGGIQKIDLSPAVEKLDKPLDLEEIYRVAHRYCGDPSTSLYH